MIACRGAEVDDADVASLWQLHQRWKYSSNDEPARLDELLADYRHWLQYRAGRAGDESAAAAFEAHWRSYVRSFAGRGFTADQADEQTSIFFERVYRLIGRSFAWACPFHVYLRQIVINNARDHARLLGDRRKREVPLDEVEISAPLASSEATPEEQAFAAEEREAVRRAILELEPGDRHIVRVCVLEGGSGQELAMTLGISRDALYQRLRRAKTRMRTTLAAFGQIRAPSESPQKRKRHGSGRMPPARAEGGEGG